MIKPFPLGRRKMMSSPERKLEEEREEIGEAAACPRKRRVGGNKGRYDYISWGDFNPSFAR